MINYDESLMHVFTAQAEHLFVRKIQVTFVDFISCNYVDIICTYPMYSLLADETAPHNYKSRVYKQHCADEPGSPSALTLVVGVAVSVIVFGIAAVYIVAIVICWR